MFFFLKSEVKPFIFLQIDHNAKEDFNLTSDVEFNAIRSLVLGRVQGKSDGSTITQTSPFRLQSTQTD